MAPQWVTAAAALLAIEAARTSREPVRDELRDRPRLDRSRIKDRQTTLADGPWSGPFERS
jgi:hypothetical protein